MNIKHEPLTQKIKILLIDGLILVIIAILIFSFFEIGAKFSLKYAVYYFQKKNQLERFNSHLFKVHPGKTKDQIIDLISVTKNEMIFEPWVQIRMPDIKSTFVNTHGLIRNSIPLEKGMNPKEKVFFFGGSTMFGYNISDNETIPSHFQALVNNFTKTKRNNNFISVQNYGQPFYFSAQEAVLFFTLLMKNQRPDVAIFMDGLNETLFKSSSYYRYPAFSDTFANLFLLHKKYPEGVSSLDYLIKELYLYRMFKVISGDITENFNLKTSSFNKDGPRYNFIYDSPAGTTDETYKDKVIENYFENISTIKKLCKAYEIKCYFFWQPVPYYNYANRKNDPLCKQERLVYVEKIYAAMKIKMRPNENEFFLGDLLNNFEGYPFADKVHYSGDFSQLIAKKMAEVIYR